MSEEGPRQTHIVMDSGALIGPTSRRSREATRSSIIRSRMPVSDRYLVAAVITQKGSETFEERRSAPTSAIRSLQSLPCSLSTLESRRNAPLEKPDPRSYIQGKPHQTLQAGGDHASQLRMSPSCSYQSLDRSSAVERSNRLATFLRVQVDGIIPIEVSSI